MSIGEGLRIEQSQNYQGDDWWSWSVWLDGSEDELDKVAKVEYTLHPTFSKPVRTVENRGDRFKLSSEGWGGFLVYATVFNKDGSARHLQHQLRLYYP
jgi:transcription initiation factor IIF auxiliary subunit